MVHRTRRPKVGYTRPICRVVDIQTRSIDEINKKRNVIDAQMMYRGRKSLSGPHDTTKAGSRNEASAPSNRHSPTHTNPVTRRAAPRASAAPPALSAAAAALQETAGAARRGAASAPCVRAESEPSDNTLPPLISSCSPSTAACARPLVHLHLVPSSHPALSRREAAPAHSSTDRDSLYARGGATCAPSSSSSSAAAALLFPTTCSFLDELASAAARRRKRRRRGFGFPGAGRRLKIPSSTLVEALARSIRGSNAGAGSCAIPPLADGAVSPSTPRGTGTSTMGILGMMGDSFGCSATGERLVSAARDGDVQEARALLELNPRLARYSTFGIRNSPLHYSAAKGHHEIVSLLIESGVNINLRNCRGQTALMQACLYGHWKVVQILVLFKANIHRRDCFSGATAIHFAALKGHTRCIRLLVADYVPSLSDFWNVMRGKSTDETKKDAFDAVSLRRLINGKSDGGVTPLHLAALHGHAESVQLLLDLGASVSEVTVNDGSTIDLIGSGSTPLHYAACGGSAVCCQLLIAAGANMGAENANGYTPLHVARSWHKNSVEGILSKQPEGRIRILPSPYLCLPLMSIIKIARECGWRKTSASSTCQDPCVICLEVECTVAAEGCGHEFCTKCALYLCSTTSSSTSTRGVPGSISCPLCRHAIVSFMKLTSATPIKELPWTSTSLALCAAGASTAPNRASSLHRRPDPRRLRSSSVQLGCSSFRSFRSGKLSSLKLNCTGAEETIPCLISCLRPDVQRSSSYRERIRRYSEF